MSNEISAKMVGELREKSGAGLMDCKRALVEAAGDMEAALLVLKKRGVANALKKSGRDALEGVIESYIHLGGRVGVLLELNCETDFVAKNEKFQALARDICMHIAAANPLYVTETDVPEAVLAGEREVALAQLADSKKPENVIENIVRGKLDKFLATICLLKQPFIKNPDTTVEEMIREKISTIGENIRVGRFVRYQIGA